MGTCEKHIRYDVRLPENCHEADKKWLCSQLVKLPKKYRERYADKYSTHYKISYDNEPNELKKNGVARIRCNNWLRQVIEVYQQKVESCNNNHK